MPYSFSNRPTIFWPCGIGVEVYQTTLPSALALATSVASWAEAGPAKASAAIAASNSLRLSMAVSPFYSIYSGFAAGALPGRPYCFPFSPSCLA